MKGKHNRIVLKMLSIVLACSMVVCESNIAYAIENTAIETSFSGTSLEAFNEDGGQIN